MTTLQEHIIDIINQGYSLEDIIDEFYFQNKASHKIENKDITKCHSSERTEEVKRDKSPYIDIKTTLKLLYIYKERKFKINIISESASYHDVDGFIHFFARIPASKMEIFEDRKLIFEKNIDASSLKGKSPEYVTENFVKGDIYEFFTSL